MNQADFARMSGLSEALISRLVSGERRPSLDTLWVIEEHLGWAINDQADEIRCETYGSVLKDKIESKISPSHLCSVCLQPKVEHGCDSGEHVRWKEDAHG